MMLGFSTQFNGENQVSKASYAGTCLRLLVFIKWLPFFCRVNFKNMIRIEDGFFVESKLNSSHHINCFRAQFFSRSSLFSLTPIPCSPETVPSKSIAIMDISFMILWASAT